MLLNNVKNFYIGGLSVKKIYKSNNLVWINPGDISSDNIKIYLNNQWDISQVQNPDPDLYYGVYESVSNHQVDDQASIMYITINNSPSFRLYIRSCSESPYDTVVVSQLDQTIDNNTDLNDTSLVAGYCDISNCNTDFNDYRLVDIPNDGGEHSITIMYRKDTSVSTGDDKGYILIPKA